MKSNVEIVIQPNRSWLRLDWRPVLEYRDLLFLLVWRDFVARYKQTVLGPLWYIIQPISTTLVFMVVFDRIAKVSTDGLPPMLFYLSGLLAWNYFAQVMGSTGTTFTSNAGMFGKVYFPRLVVPLAVSVSNLIAFAIQLATFLILWAQFKFFTSSGNQFQMTVWLSVLPLVLVHLALLSVGVGLWISSFTAKFRDLAHALGLITQLWMYATPIIYPLSEIPDQWRWLASLNPVTAVTEYFRLAFLGQSAITPGIYCSSVAITLFVFISGALLFQRVERNFIDTV